jgi:hypothetical protein
MGRERVSLFLGFVYAVPALKAVVFLLFSGRQRVRRVGKKSGE